MAELPELTLAFLQRQPASAARTLERLQAEDAAELMGRVPVRISTPVFAAMTSIAAARCAEHLPAAVTAALCESLSWADASALLRQLTPRTQAAALSRMPANLSRKFRRSLDYAQTAIGAWTEMDVPVIVENRTASEAIRLVAQFPDFSASHLLLTNDVQHYTGVVPLAALLRASPTAGLDTLADRSCRPARDSASLASVASNPGWETTTLLPIVNHRGELLGGLLRRTLERALNEHADETPTSRHSVVAYLLGTYLVAGEGLLRLLLQGVRRNDPADEQAPS